MTGISEADIEYARIQLNRVKALLASIESEIIKDKENGAYFNGFHDGGRYAIQWIRDRIAGAMFDFTVTVEPKPE